MTDVEKTGPASGEMNVNPEENRPPVYVYIDTNFERHK